MKWRKRLSDDDYNKVCNKLKSLIHTDDIHTSSWILGHDWEGTEYQPLYYACDKNDIQAGLFFGLILLKIMMETPDDINWGFGRYEKDGIPIRGTTYFRIQL